MGRLVGERLTARQSRSLITFPVLSLICSRRGKVRLTLFPRIIKLRFGIFLEGSKRASPYDTSVGVLSPRKALPGHCYADVHRRIQLR